MSTYINITLSIFVGRIIENEILSRFIRLETNPEFKQLE